MCAFSSVVTRLLFVTVVCSAQAQHTCLNDGELQRPDGKDESAAMKPHSLLQATRANPPAKPSEASQANLPAKPSEDLSSRRLVHIDAPERPMLALAASTAAGERASVQNMSHNASQEEGSHDLAMAVSVSNVGESSLHQARAKDTLAAVSRGKLNSSAFADALKAASQVNASSQTTLSEARKLLGINKRAHADAREAMALTLKETIEKNRDAEKPKQNAKKAKATKKNDNDVLEDSKAKSKSKSFAAKSKANKAATKEETEEGKVIVEDYKGHMVVSDKAILSPLTRMQGTFGVVLLAIFGFWWAKMYREHNAYTW